MSARPARSSLLAACTLVVGLAGCVATPRFDGPMPVRNQHPAQLTVLHMEPADASPLAAGEVEMRADGAYSSLFLGGNNGINTFEMDGEILRAALKARVGLGENLELRFELPVAHTTGGFLDSFLIDFHEFFGAPSQGRPDAAQDRFFVRGTQLGSTVWRMDEDSFELLDIPTELSWAFLPVTEDRPYGMAVRAAVEWPTGDADRGFGSGEPDFAVGLVGEARTRHVAVTAHVQHAFAGTPDLAERNQFEYQDVTSVGVGFEVPLTVDATLLLQTEYETSVLRDLDLSRAADPQWLLWTGFRARVNERMGLDLALAEDLSSFTSPDFSAYIGLTVRIGRAEGSP